VGGYILRMLPIEFLFRHLNEAGARYVVVGGLAVVLHGHLRATGDVDLIVDLAPEQVDRTLAALDQAGFRPYVPVPARDFADPAKRAAWAREKGMLVFSLRPLDGVPMVDLFVEYPIPFDGLWDRSVVVQVRGVPVRIASIQDLITLKRRAGRPEDLADIEALAEIARLRAGDS
jgi:predicted nucleotidyltransferase